MIPAKKEVNKDFKDNKLDFTFGWDVLQEEPQVGDAPEECPNCGMLSKTSPCQFCGAACKAATVTGKVLIYKQKQSATSTGNKVTTRVYCIDISGSMQGERFNYVKTKILEDLKVLVRNNPNDKVCIVTFESDCHIIGDGTKPEVLVGCECSFEKICEIAENNKELLPIKESIDKLRVALNKIECVGRTASISALVLATKLASFTGGEVFYYTDGMRNKGLPPAGNVIKISQMAKDEDGKKNVFIHIHFFNNCQSFITEYSQCASDTNGDIKPINLGGKEVIKSEGSIKRTYVGHNLKIVSKMTDNIKNEKGDGYITEIAKVANNENYMVRFIVPENTTAKGKVGSDIYAQTKVEYVDENGNQMKAYINGEIKVSSSIEVEDTQQVICNHLNNISRFIEEKKYKEAQDELKQLNEYDFRISNDGGNFFKNAFNELTSYISNVEKGVTNQEDVVALLSYMRTARKDGIKV